MQFISDLKRIYPIILETGVILALLLVMSAFKFPSENQETLTFPPENPDITKSIETPITEQIETPANLPNRAS